MFGILSHQGNANPNHIEIPFHPVRTAIMKTKNKCWSPQLATVEISMEFPQKLKMELKTWLKRPEFKSQYHPPPKKSPKTKTRTTICSSYTTPECTLRNPSRHTLEMPEHSDCSSIHYSQAMESVLVPWTDQWIKKMWYIYTAEFYSAIKKNEMLIRGKIVSTGDHHVKWNKPDSERQIECFLLCAESTFLKKDTEGMSVVAHACNSKYLEVGGKRIKNQGQSRQKLLRPYLKNKPGKPGASGSHM
jgi:hypothetical protein